ncbi:serine dehydratase alpha chain-domain-containing protein [Roridomyces roridus]|uniref:Serine dehydratase alpha chain-domain-containing protein n=1 Tax=Roridomyces roridus TaxID=1738132 RepID=A0AAD7FJY7_9AGAR|nr:serine dehydratase alpha chain-domain-containing protein [Roridomyces roridus]
MLALRAHSRAFLLALGRRPLSGSALPEHAVISTFDLFSIGVGPSSSHTVGPMRAGRIFCADLKELDLLEKGSHHTPQAVLLGLEGNDPQTIDPGTIPSRYETIVKGKSLLLAGYHRIPYDMDRDMLWRWDQVLEAHPNGMRFSVFDEEGGLLATNEYFSVGGGFVSNSKTKVDENLFYKGVDKKAVHGARLHQAHTDADSNPLAAVEEPNQETSIPYPFSSGNSLLELTKKHNMTIAQIVWDNEKSFGYSDDEIHSKITKIWSVMDDCIRAGVSSTETTLPGRLGLRRRAPMLYRRLMRGYFALVQAVSTPELQLQRGIRSSRQGSAGWRPDTAIDDPEGTAKAALPKHGDSAIDPNSPTALRPALSRRPTRVVGSFEHSVLPMPPRKTVIPAMDFLSCYAIAVNEVNAAGGRIVTSPTNGAAGVIPAFVSDDPEKSVVTFLLTASAIGMLFKRGSTISAAEGGCQAEVGVACSMASAGFAACMGASPETVLQAAEIGIEHNLGLTCDPIDGLVQVPCIERNSLGAVKAITAAQLSLASDGVYSVTLDEAIEAMRLTAADMSVKYKETSLSTSVKIPLTVPAC